MYNYTFQNRVKEDQAKGDDAGHIKGVEDWVDKIRICVSPLSIARLPPVTILVCLSSYCRPLLRFYFRWS